MERVATSAISRRERDGSLDTACAGAAINVLRDLRQGWQEILSSELVLVQVQRLLRVHPGYSVDSLLVAAVLVAAEHGPHALEFVSVDERFNEAASREGFPIADACRS